MGARHEAAIAKEKRLEQVTRPATSTAAEKRERQEDNEFNKQVKKVDKKPAKKKQKVEVNKADLENANVVLEEDDEVAEGINWSDDDDDDDDDSSDSE